MEKIKPYDNFDVNYLAQSEEEWLRTGSFKIENVQIGERVIRCAYCGDIENPNTVVMAGGIPRDPDRRSVLPLINKLYGNLARRLAESISPHTSILYNQPATGGSSGVWELETLGTRTEVLADITKYYCHANLDRNITLIGTSAGGYLALQASELLRNQNINVKKLVLLSPAAYPQGIDSIPYGEDFTNLIRSNWDIRQSPSFTLVENFVRMGGEVYITFFEFDDPPIPSAIQEKYYSLAQSLQNEGLAISTQIIPGVAHNFRNISPDKKGDAINNESVRNTSELLERAITHG